MNRFRFVVLILFVAALFVGCSDDDNPADSADFLLVGTWISDSAAVNGVSYDIPSDTLIYRYDYTGSYRPENGWGPYDFDYSLRNDSIFRVRTWGQSEGLVDTCEYEATSSQLIEVITTADETRIHYFTKK
ncbi:MAG: hypothetical protein PVH24_08115 [Candidatus Zixiibacteriota bacterium]|jgi:hypothetical protein